MKIKRLITLAAFAAVAVFTSTLLFSAYADSNSINFEAPTYTTGSINGQDGWSSLGSAMMGCANYDHAVTANGMSAPASFGGQSLRISNAVTSGCFGDQTFSKSLFNEAGETSAVSNGLSTGPRKTHYEAQWSFASTVPNAEQVGLSVVASPDRGDGARMSWVQMRDAPSGLEVNFFDYQSGAVETGCVTGDNFIFANVAGGLDRTAPHTIKITMDFVNGSANDVVKVYVDGTLFHTGTSWEDYFRECETNPTRTVDSILFRTGGTAAPGTLGQGFLIDNLSTSSTNAPIAANQCKNGGWQNYTRADGSSFRNQGDCVSYVNTGR